MTASCGLMTSRSFRSRNALATLVERKGPDGDGDAPGLWPEPDMEGPDMNHSTSPPADSRKPRRFSDLSEAEMGPYFFPGFLAMLVIAFLTDSWGWTIAAGFAVPWFIWRTER